MDSLLPRVRIVFLNCIIQDNALALRAKHVDYMEDK